MKIFDDKIQMYRDMLDRHLVDIYSTGPDSLKRPINHVLSGKGKRFRPILTLIVSDINNIPGLINLNGYFLSEDQIYAIYPDNNIQRFYD